MLRGDVLMRHITTSGFYLLETGSRRVRAVASVYCTQPLPKAALDWYYPWHRAPPQEAGWLMRWHQVCTKDHESKIVRRPVSSVTQVWAWHLCIEEIHDPMFYRHPNGVQEWIRNMPERIAEEHDARGLPMPRLLRAHWPLPFGRIQPIQ